MNLFQNNLPTVLALSGVLEFFFLSPSTPCWFLKSGTNETIILERNYSFRDEKGKVRIGVPRAEL